MTGSTIHPILISNVLAASEISLQPLAGAALLLVLTRSNILVAARRGSGVLADIRHTLRQIVNE